MVVPKSTSSGMKPISDKFFYKEMAKIKEKNKNTGGAGVLPPKKSASAYIIFQKTVSLES